MKQEDKDFIKKTLAPVPDLARVLKRAKDGKLLLSGGIMLKRSDGTCDG